MNHPKAALHVEFHSGISLRVGNRSFVILLNSDAVSSCDFQNLHTKRDLLPNEMMGFTSVVALWITGQMKPLGTGNGDGRGHF